MFYLADAAIIFCVLIVIFATSGSIPSTKLTLLERVAITYGIFLGGWGIFIAAIGSLDLDQALNPTKYLLPFSFFLFSFRGSRKYVLESIQVTIQRICGLRGLELTLFGYLCLTFALTFLLTLAPPNANDYDSLVYHLATPQRYIDIGRIVELPYDHHTYFPFLNEMLFMLGLAWQGPVLAKLFHWLMLPLCCFSLIAIGSRHFSRRVGLVAACLFASIPIVLIEATTAYVDLALCAFVLLAFLSFANWLVAKQDGWWLSLCGTFCGFALATKYSGALFFAWIFIWAIGSIVFKPKNSEVSQKVTSSFITHIWDLRSFLFLAVFLGSGWYLRNIDWTGNPVYPFAYEIFGGKGWTLEMAQAYTRDQEAFGFGRGVLDFLLAPWRVAMAPLNFNLPFWPLPSTPLENGAVGRFETPGHILQTLLGPHLLAFGLPLFFMRRKPALIGFLLWTFVLFWIFWFVTSQQIRYLLPTAALLCVCCGWGVLRLIERGPILKWTCAIALGAWLLFAPAYVFHRLSDVLPVVLGKETPEVFLTRTFPGYSAMQWASTQTPEKSRFAVYGEPRCFYLRRDYFWADDGHNNLIDYEKVKSGAQLVAALKEQGATHVLVNTEAARNGGFGGVPEHFDDAVSRANVELLFEARGYQVYEIVGAEIIGATR